MPSQALQDFSFLRLICDRIIKAIMTEEKNKPAQEKQGEELWMFVRSQNPGVVANATLNRNLTEEMAVHIAKKKNTAPETLGFLANDIRFKDSYKLKLALCRNPKTPQKVTLSLLKFLRIFDLGDLTKDQHIPVNIRQKIEYSLLEKLPAMPAGNMIALSKRASSSIVVALMEKGDKKVLKECLDSPVLTEALVFKAINKGDARPVLVKMVAEHPQWSLRYHIRIALIRNYHTPMVQATQFISGLKTTDLKELYHDKNIPLSTKPFLFRELMDRGSTVEIEEEETYELSDEAPSDASYEN